MKEALLQFRKTCQVLMDEHGYNVSKLSKETGFAQLTLQKLLKSDLSELKGVRASSLGIIQDFNKKHVDHVAFSGGGAPEGEDNASGRQEAMPEPPGMKCTRVIPKRKPKDYLQRPEIPGEHLEAILKPDLLDLLADLGKNLPSNVKVNITIN